MTRTPLERLDREINMYLAVIDRRRDACADTVDHEAHLQLLYVQRAVMVSGPAPGAIDDVTALLDAEPPVLGIAAALAEELEGHTRPVRILVATYQPAHRRRGWFGRLLDAWRAPRPPEDPHRTLGRGGFDHFLP